MYKLRARKRRRSGPRNRKREAHIMRAFRVFFHQRDDWSFVRTCRGSVTVTWWWCSITIFGWRKSSEVTSDKILLCKNEYWEGRRPATRFQWEILSLAEKRESQKRKEEFMSGGVGPPFARIMIEFFRYKTLVAQVNVWSPLCYVKNWTCI